MDKIKKIDDDWLEYAKDYMKVRFSSDDNLPLNKQLKFLQYHCNYQMCIQ